MSDYSNVNICGRMTEPKFVNVGERNTLKATFSVAINRFRMRSDRELDRLEQEAIDSGENFDRQNMKFEKKTVWKKCVAWGKLAEQVREYGKKGVRIICNGDEDVEYYHNSDGRTEEYQFVRLRLLSIFNLNKMNGGESFASLD